MALEHGAARARHALFGIDLSPGGIRVEPHPELALGDHIRIALFDGTSSHTIVLDAEAVRDDGTRGVVLRFVDPPEGARRDLAALLARAPEIESRGHGSGDALVVAEWVERRPA